jgi:transcriptional regulator with XRE-family HTH domain
MDLRDLIRNEIARRHISQAAFGRRVGASAGLVSRWLSEEVPTQPGYQYCLRIARELGMESGEVLRLAGHQAVSPPSSIEELPPRQAAALAVLARGIRHIPDSVLDDAVGSAEQLFAVFRRAAITTEGEVADDIPADGLGRYNSQLSDLTDDYLSPMTARFDARIAHTAEMVGLSA